MSICVTSTGKSLDSQTDFRFGRCAFFVFVDENSVETVENPAVSAAHGAGIQAARLVMDKKPEAVITGNVGPNASSVLTNAGIKVYLFTGGTVGQAVKAYKNGELKESEGPTVGGHFGAGGQGRGRGRRR